MPKYECAGPIEFHFIANVTGSFSITSDANADALANGEFKIEAGQQTTFGAPVLLSFSQKACRMVRIQMEGGIETANVVERSIPRKPFFTMPDMSQKPGATGRAVGCAMAGIMVVVTGLLLLFIWRTRQNRKRRTENIEPGEQRYWPAVGLSGKNESEKDEEKVSQSDDPEAMIENVAENGEPVVAEVAPADAEPDGPYDSDVVVF
jgi:hypothetical protein